MLAGAMDVNVDKTRPIILPDYLREISGLKKEIIVAGFLYSRLEFGYATNNGMNIKKKTEAESNIDSEQMAAELGSLIEKF
jgi:DNA-binding transcriptional regulator/RsmH inhibitor MraZ